MDYINQAGFEDMAGEAPSSAQVETCKSWLLTFAEPGKAINRRAWSYKMKHIVEDWAGHYVSNGAFIQAAVDLGYEYVRLGLNAWFNMRMKSRHLTERVTSRT